MRRGAIAIACLLLLILGVSLFFFQGQAATGQAETGETDTTETASSGPASTGNTETAALQSIVHSEEFILKYTPHLSDLKKRVLTPPKVQTTHDPLFEEQVKVRDLSGETTAERDATEGAVAVTTRLWKADDTASTRPAKSIDLWKPFLEQVDRFEHAKFKIVRGHFTTPDRDVFEADVAFEGLARSRSGAWWGVHSDQTLQLRKHNFTGKPVWLISEWRAGEFETIEQDHLLFRDVLDQAIPDERARAEARRSRHEEFVIANVKSGKRPHPMFETIGWDRHPGIAVTDIDDDGFDDFYVVTRWGKSQFFRNQRDGTFKEIANDLGLDIDSFSSSAVFADFDNDGDLDVFLGRTLERSMYLVNEDGRFVDHSSTHMDVPLPYFVSAVSAADYNNDGLLDLYISTYAGQMLRRAISRDSHHKEYLVSRLPENDANELMQLATDSSAHVWVNWPGPPNVLLRNVGNGHFVEARETKPPFLFRNTYAATWSDYDNDGDPDLYCANDLAPDNLFRNEGDGNFVDVTNDAGLTTMGFAMGASWGDYDEDGRTDLYITNMYSKAGRRITGQIDGIDERIVAGALGNWLYRNTGETFEKTSGSSDGQLQVEAAGWGWGSQFVDVDNDGRLDIYAPNGYYTAADEIAVPQDH